MSRLQRLERQVQKVFGPRLYEIPVFRCVFADGSEEEMSVLEFAHALFAEGREGKAHERVGTRWEPVKAVHDRAALDDAFREMRERFIADQAKFE